MRNWYSSVEKRSTYSPVGLAIVLPSTETVESAPAEPTIPTVTFDDFVCDEPTNSTSERVAPEAIVGATKAAPSDCEQIGDSKVGTPLNDAKAIFSKKSKSSAVTSGNPSPARPASPSPAAVAAPNNGTGTPGIVASPAEKTSATASKAGLTPPAAPSTAGLPAVNGGTGAVGVKALAAALEVVIAAEKGPTQPAAQRNADTSSAKGGTGASGVGASTAVQNSAGEQKFGSGYKWLTIAMSTVGSAGMVLFAANQIVRHNSRSTSVALL